MSTLAAIGVVLAVPGAPVAVAIATGFAIATNLDVVENVFNDVVDTLSDPEFWELFEQHRNDFFSPLFEFIDDAQVLIDDLMADVNEIFSDIVTIQHNLMQKVLDRVSGQISLKLTALHRAA
ncbi:MAG: hypothetical protein H5U30_16180 [Marinobacter sp.]|nr:hypothetical protein [Marinobacter sp.]